MKYTKNLAIALAALAVAGLSFLPADARAQIDTRRDGDRYDRTRPRNWDRDRDDRRGPSVETLARRTERASNAFRDWFERQYRDRRLGRDPDGRSLKAEVQGLDEAMERVRRRADGDSTRGRHDFEEAMDHARRIDRALVFERDRDTRFTTREWIDLRLTLDDLARAYGVRRI